MPEPRPQQLITGDRALQLLDTASSAALQQAGVKVATVSLVSYQNLVNTLTPEVFAGLDPVTGKLVDGVIPDRLSAAAISALNLLDVNGTVAQNYLPPYLTTNGLTSTIAGTSAVQLDTDPDGSPVILGSTPLSSSLTFTGTVTAGTLTAGTTHGDVITGTYGQITTVESTSTILDNQSVAPGTPAAGAIKVYGNNNSRLSWLDSSGTVYLAANKRIVTTWPANVNSQLGDEAIISATGEHRIYKGSTLGWRLASPFQVADVATRNAITSPYTGMRVFVAAGVGQDHIYRADGVWHGTVPYFVTAGAVQSQNSVNDTNFRLRHTTDIPDPGYPYRVKGRMGFEVVQLGIHNRIEVWCSAADLATGLNPQTFHVSYIDPGPQDLHFDINPWSYFDITGGKKLIVSWRSLGNGSNAYSTNYQSYQDWQVVPV